MQIITLDWIQFKSNQIGSNHHIEFNHHFCDDKIVTIVVSNNYYLVNLVSVRLPYTPPPKAPKAKPRWASV